MPMSVGNITAARTLTLLRRELIGANNRCTALCFIMA